LFYLNKDGINEDEVFLQFFSAEFEPLNSAEKKTAHWFFLKNVFKVEVKKLFNFFFVHKKENFNQVVA